MILNVTLSEISFRKLARACGAVFIDGAKNVCKGFVGWLIICCYVLVCSPAFSISQVAKEPQKKQ